MDTKLRTLFTCDDKFGYLCFHIPGMLISCHKTVFSRPVFTCSFAARWERITLGEFFLQCWEPPKTLIESMIFLLSKGGIWTRSKGGELTPLKINILNPKITRLEKRKNHLPCTSMTLASKSSFSRMYPPQKTNITNHNGKSTI